MRNTEEDQAQELEGQGRASARGNKAASEVSCKCLWV